ncbi:hypothetical protein OJ996_09150 [Luteolibacter sp. GHJ8]|uniref:Minor tail protein n=1 Tax=Luteolibacter rhizosphaerae TaxID=2989719 RepID=A0ABT3G1M9_9BACT|nr:hypothetical protein [Luteolibacter rhizosphaerae]MCW1913740.1 hypothetical protein [Luteolibacter rhizosphaerae]
MPSNIWTYSGEVGKRLDGNMRPFDPVGAQISFNALDSDIWSWSVDLADIVPGSEIYPEKDQVVSLFRNGQRFFRGHALMPRQDGYRIGVQVVGPWHWMNKIPLSKAVTLDAASGGGTSQRASIGFPAQSLTTSLGTLIDRMIALGVPIQKGTIATTFTSIPLTLRQGSCADAFVHLARKVGDMSMWIDYSGTGLPRLNITRRKAGLSVGTAEAITLDVSQLAPQFKCIPEDDWRVSLVRVPYFDRAPNGLRRNQEQKAGTPELGHELLLTASGDELDTFLPEEKLDSVQVKTMASNANAADMFAFLNTADPLLADLRSRVGFNWYRNVARDVSAQHGVTTGTPLLYHDTNPSSFSTPVNFPTAPPVLKRKDGTTLAGVWHIVTNDATIPDWFKEENGITVEEVDLVAQTYVSIAWKSAEGVLPVFSPLDEYAAASQSKQGRHNLFASTYNMISHFIRQSTIRVKVLNASYPGLTTVYRQPSYTFISPPAGFAQGILEARNWTPHVGALTLEEEDCGGQRYLGRVINVTGADPTFATMRAMVQSETLALDTGTTTIALGPPARLEFPNLLDQQSTNPNNQIVYL